MVLTETLVGVAGDRAILAHDRNVDKAKTSAIHSLDSLGKGIGTTDKWKSISGRLLPDSNLIGYLDTTTFREISERAIDPEQKANYDKMLAPFLTRLST